MSSSAIRYNYNGPSDLAAIQIILQKNGQPDDKLVIRPAHGSMNFQVVFTQNTIGTRVDYEVSHSDLFPYLERFLNTVFYDEQACQYVQFDVPGYSSAMIKAANVGFYMDTFYSQVRSLHNCWPYEVEGVKVAPTPQQVWHAAQMEGRPIAHTKVSVRSPSPRVTRSKTRLSQ